MAVEPEDLDLAKDLHETWQLRSDADNDLLIVGTPGGGLAIWEPAG